MTTPQAERTDLRRRPEVLALRLDAKTGRVIAHDLANQLVAAPASDLVYLMRDRGYLGATDQVLRYVRRTPGTDLGEPVFGVKYETHVPQVERRDLHRLIVRERPWVLLDLIIHHLVLATHLYREDAADLAGRFATSPLEVTGVALPAEGLRMLEHLLFLVCMHDATLRLSLRKVGAGENFFAKKTRPVPMERTQAYRAAGISPFEASRIEQDGPPAVEEVLTLGALRGPLLPGTAFSD